VIFEGVNERVVCMVQGDGTEDRSYLGYMVNEIQSLIAHLDACPIRALTLLFL